MLAQSEHAVEGQARVVTSALVNGDAVDDVALAEIFERPEEMLGSDAEHGRADADAVVKRHDRMVFQFFVEAIDKMDFSANGHRVPAGEAWMALMMPSVEPI